MSNEDETLLEFMARDAARTRELWSQAPQELWPMWYRRERLCMTEFPARPTPGGAILRCELDRGHEGSHRGMKYPEKIRVTWDAEPTE